MTSVKKDIGLKVGFLTSEVIDFVSLAFTGKVAGDAMSGEMGIGMMGSFPFTGKRA